MFLTIPIDSARPIHPALPPTKPAAEQEITLELPLLKLHTSLESDRPDSDDDPSAGPADCSSASAAGNRLRIVRPIDEERLTPDRQALVARHIGLVATHLRQRVPTPRWSHRNREYSDLFQEGCLALVRAALRYQPRRDGPSFPAYAMLRIRGAIHTAVSEHFLTIRVPARVSRSMSPAEAAATAVQELSHEVAKRLPAGEDVPEKAETIHDLIRQRYQRAVRLALHEMRGRAWPRKNPIPIMERILDERLLVVRGGDRLSLRRLAHEEGVSIGRVSSYERKLLEAAQQILAADPQLALLIRWARRDPRGFAGRIDADRRRRLVRAEVRAFGRRFGGLPRDVRAELLYAMLERSTPAVAEVACNLYRLTMDESADDNTYYQQKAI